ncbi:5'/3'-nucleotidase SurE [Chitinimonas sp.]|uniref:5'/3'-nucleotidase SurE n=1 Tax=Chitinimonas sp. TaxID=1934313 RepID=UPI0035AE4133
MKFLLSNDDGYFAPGLAALAAELGKVGEVTVVAPERDRSGASNSLTLDRPLNVRQAPSGFSYVNGTPTDCVHLAVTGLMAQAPDIVLTGINAGPNMGDDTIYSGTVAAATEAYLLGVPAIALSLAGRPPLHYATAARIARELVERLQRDPWRGAMLLNVNVPDLPYEQLKGVRVCRLGRRHKAEPVIPAQNPRGETIWWVGPPGSAQDAAEDTDFWAVSNGYVAITPLQIDLTAFKQLDFLAGWLA